MQGDAGHTVAKGTVRGTPLGLLVFAIAWQAGSLASEPALWPWAAVDRIDMVLLSCVWLGMLLSALALSWRRLRTFLPGALAVNVATSVITSLVLLARDNPQVFAEWRAGASLVNVSVALIGLWLPARRALVLIAATVMAEALVLVFRGSIGSEIVPWENDVMYPTYALVIGISSSAVRSALERVRARTARSLELAQRTQREVEVSLAVEQSIREREVRIHEVVLNTLNALARGRLDGISDHIVKRRAGEAAEVLEELGATRLTYSETTHGSLRAMLADVIELAEERSISVVVRGDIPEDLPADIRRALRFAVREAATNAVRHAQASRIEVHARNRGGTLRIEVSDNGRGFDATNPPDGYGINAAILQGMKSVGGTAEVHSSIGAGCIVTLEWSASGLPESLDMLNAERGAVVGPVIAIFTLFAVVSSIVTFPRITSFVGLFVALVMLCVAGIVLLVRTRQGQVTWLWSLGIIAAAAGVYLVQSSSVASDGSTWGEWGSEAASVLMFSVAVAGPRYVWVAAILVWLIVQGDFLRELVAPGTIFIAVGALLGEILRRAAKQDYRNLQDQARADIEVAGSREVLSRLAARQVVLQHAHTSVLLRGVESGTIPWNGDKYQEVWNRHEGFLRTSLRLDPDTHSLHSFLARITLLAWDSGLDVDISLGSWSSDMDVPIHLQEGATALIALSPERSQVRCAGIDDGQRLTLRIVAVMVSQALDSPENLPGVVMWDPASRTAMWEVSGDRKEATWL